MKKTVVMMSVCGMLISGCGNGKVQKSSEDKNDAATEQIVVQDVLASRATDPNEIYGTWIILTADGMDASDGMKTATVSFGTDGSMTGNTSINNYFGSYDFTDGNLKCNMAGITMMAGPKMEIESAVKQALSKTHSIVIVGDHANVYDADNNLVMTLEKSATEISDEE